MLPLKKNFSYLYLLRQLTPLLFLLGFLFVIAMPFIFLMCCGGSPYFDADPAHYERAIKILPSPNCDHFPVKITHDPSKVRFYHEDMEAFGGQGGHRQIELWMKLEPTEIERLFFEYEKRKTPARLMTKSNLDDEKPGGFFTLDDPKAPTPSALWKPPQLGKSTPVPDDFQLFRLDQGENMYFRGVAISKKRSVIIYYAGYAWAS